MHAIEHSELPSDLVAPLRSELPIEHADAGRMVVASRPSHHLFDVRLDLYDSVSAAAEQIIATARLCPTGSAVFTCNLDHLALMRDNASFKTAYQRAEITTIDGAPLALLSRITGTRAARRVTGVDLVTALLPLAERQSLRIALVGGAPGHADEAARRISASHPNIPDIFTACPTMGFSIGDEDDNMLVESLAQYRPDIVVVCLGAPRQELWIDEHKHRLPGAALIGAGATIDFLSGQRPRAPRFCQRTGTEALWRLATEFPRLWRRYLVRDIGLLVQFPAVYGSYTAARWGMSASSRSHSHEFSARQAHSSRPCAVCTSSAA